MHMTTHTFGKCIWALAAAGTMLCAHAQTNETETQNSADAYGQHVIVVPNGQSFPALQQYTYPENDRYAPYSSTSDIPTHAGPGWMALTYHNDVWELHETAIQIKEAPLEGEDVNGATVGHLISSTTVPNALVLLRDHSLIAGPIEAPEVASWTPPRSAPPPNNFHAVFEYDIEMAGTTYRLQLERYDNSNNVYPSDTLTITNLSTGQTSPPLSTSPEDETTRGIAALWIADLNRDGRPDLIVKFDSYNETYLCLFLSDNPPPGQMFRHAGCYSAYGC